MFIATSARSTDLAPVGAKRGGGNLPEQSRGIALLQSYGVKKGPPDYKHLAPQGRSDHQSSMKLPFEFVLCFLHLVFRILTNLPHTTNRHQSTKLEAPSTNNQQLTTNY